MDKRDVYEKKMKEKLDQWRDRIDELKVKADQAEAEAKIEYHQQIDKLRAMQRASEEKMRKLRTAGDDAWEDLKAGMDMAWESLGEAVRSAASRFK